MIIAKLYGWQIENMLMQFEKGFPKETLLATYGVNEEIVFFFVLTMVVGSINMMKHLDILAE